MTFQLLKSLPALFTQSRVKQYNTRQDNRNEKLSSTFHYFAAVKLAVHVWRETGTDIELLGLIGVLLGRLQSLDEIFLFFLQWANRSLQTLNIVLEMWNKHFNTTYMGFTNIIFTIWFSALPEILFEWAPNDYHSDTSSWQKPLLAPKLYWAQSVPSTSEPVAVHAGLCRLLVSFWLEDQHRLPKLLWMIE